MITNPCEQIVATVGVCYFWKELQIGRSIVNPGVCRKDTYEAKHPCGYYEVFDSHLILLYLIKMSFAVSLAFAVETFMK